MSVFNVNAQTLSFDSLYLLKNKKVCVTEYIAIDNECYNIGDTLEILNPADIGYYRFIISYDYYPSTFPLMYRGKKITIDEFVVTGTKNVGFEVLCNCFLENGQKIEVNIDRAILCEEIRKVKVSNK
jgi:hypothetical protein